MLNERTTNGFHVNDVVVYNGSPDQSSGAIMLERGKRYVVVDWYADMVCVWEGPCWAWASGELFDLVTRPEPTPDHWQWVI